MKHTPTVERVGAYRKAARAVVRGHDPVRDRYASLVSLATEARSEADETVRRWAERAVWEESRSFLTGEPDRPDVPPEPFIEAQRKLRSRRLTVCPTCWRPVATDDEFECWHQRQADHEAEVARREASV